MRLVTNEEAPEEKPPGDAKEKGDKNIRNRRIKITSKFLLENSYNVRHNL